MKQSTANITSLTSAKIPEQSDSHMDSLGSENNIISRAAISLKAGQVIVWENGPVMALAGNADDPELTNEISRIKRDRSPNQPVAWIATFQDSSPAFDLTDVHDRSLTEFLSDPDFMTKRLGGLAFIRATADLEYKANFDISDAIIPKYGIGTDPSNVQIYSPTGNNRCSKLIRYANTLGVRIAMSSANYHKHKELVEYDEAEAFARSAGELPFFAEHAQDAKPLRPRGSYPVIKVEKDHLKVVRYGFLAPEIIERLLYDLPVDTSPIDSGQVPNHPDNVLREEDLPANSIGLYGRKLRSVILDNFINVGSTFDSQKTQTN